MGSENTEGFTMRCPYCNKKFNPMNYPYVVTTRQEGSSGIYYRNGIKNRQKFRQFVDSIKDTGTRITSVKHCTVDEYNELRKGYYVPDFIQ